MSRLRDLPEEVHHPSFWQLLLVYVSTSYAILQAAGLARPAGVQSTDT